MSPTFSLLASLEAAGLEGHIKTYGASVLELDSSLVNAPSPADLIDLTHGDTRAFVPPAAAAGDMHSACGRGRRHAFRPRPRPATCIPPSSRTRRLTPLTVAVARFVPASHLGSGPCSAGRRGAAGSASTFLRTRAACSLLSRGSRRPVVHAARPLS